MGFFPSFSDAFVTSLKSPQINQGRFIILAISFRLLNKILLNLMLFFAYIIEIIHVGEEVVTRTVACISCYVRTIGSINDLVVVQQQGYSPEKPEAGTWIKSVNGNCCNKIS